MKISRPKINKKIVILALLLTMILLATAFIYMFVIKNDNKLAIKKTDVTEKPAVINKTETEKLDDTIHFAAMGDMLAHDTIIANAKTGTGYDFSKYFTNIRSSYDSADVVFCDQEGASAGEQYGISGYPSFNAPLEFPAGLQSGAGCNVINLANNHMGDKGVAVTDATIDAWTNLKSLATSGANKSAEDQNKISYFTKNNIKVGFVAFMDFNNNGSTPSYSVNNYHDQDLVKRLVNEARANSDVVMVSMHWGIEDSNIVSSDQETQVDLLGSLGVDVVIGTGPHVLQKVDLIDRADGGKMLVWYSLGNMLSSQLQAKELIGGIAKFDITKADSKVLISNVKFTPTYMHYEWTATEAANGDLSARKNAMIYLLNNATEPLSRSLLNTSVGEQKQYVIDTLGNKVTVE